MTQHVYLARPGFSQEPIDHAQWLAAAQQVPALVVRAYSSREHGEHHQVLLAADPAQQLQWSAKGVAVASGPSQAMVEAMFALAPLLQAAVYSESRRAYASVEDWAQRTQRQAQRRAASSREGSGLLGRLDARTRRRLGYALAWLLLLALCVAVAVQLGAGSDGGG